MAPIKNLATSVHRRLLNEAKKSGRPFNELLQYFAMERFLYRLSRSRYAPHFVLKGALMLLVWDAPVSRPTKDVDLLGERISNDVESLAQVVREVLETEVEPDGLTVDVHTIEAREITEAAEYGGIRVTWMTQLGTARVKQQLDVGFGDLVLPEAQSVEYPTILDFPPPRLRSYTRESVIAEKFHAMVRFGDFNSRMNDFFDVWLLSRHFPFSGERLGEVIGKTFANRNTEVPGDPYPLTGQFAEIPLLEGRWTAFLKRSRVESCPPFPEVIASLAEFLAPVAASLAAEKRFDGRWEPPGPWE
ncbi:MAG TPA: nucleotidyl transferase AbiEii/AbiGii toxin family protein [Thermoleophilia bacterium]|nr:nucleotidyl transferase AbiEii/AbiGii toxin family protein [Thermoleophilia bacterium]